MELDLRQCKYSSLLFLVLALFSLCRGSLAGSGFNGVLSKTIYANVTCGSPAEFYYRTQEGNLHPRLRTLLVCDANDSKNAHPPEYLVDGDLATFWQSRASIDKAEIRIDLNQEIFGYEISITFGDYRRPEQIAFRKSKDYGATFEPWHFVVSPPAMDQCREVFNMEVTINPEKVDTAICQQYPNYFPLEYNETFTIDLNGQQRGDGSSSSNYHTPGILAWMKITNLQITFTGLFQKFDRLSTTWHHYAVREIGLTGKCNCHGYADGFDCPLNPVTKLRECKCKGNTCGLYCEKCCPAFNQYPWKQGDGAPWVWNGTTTCEACNCHSHSDICAYNQTVADKSLSLDIYGQRRGGGVCIDCKHNTEGLNCEKCKTHYYRPINRSKTSVDTCEECGCNIAGTLNLPNMTYLDCVRDEVEMKFHGGKKPGDCYCKKNVMGRTCATCKDEFYELNQNNPDGCRGCGCYLPGTVNGSNTCEKNNNGNCPCKPNTRERDCAQCKPGFFNLRAENVDGCEDCGCDPGASVPGSFCNNITGICQCFPHIYGKQCKSIEVGYYYPGLHFISAEKDLYQPATPTLSVILDIPKTGSFRIMIGYTLKISGNAQLDIKFISNSDHDVINSTSVRVSQCASYCYHKVSSSFLHLSKGKISVMINSSQGDLELDKLVAIPEGFYVNTVLGPRASSHFQFQCNIDDNDMRLGTHLEEFCLSNVFSLTIAYNKGPLNCNCNVLGSYNHTTCNPHGGQCHCKPGVTGRDCSQCLPEFYNLSDEGCTPCGCRGENKLCNVTTGWCECPPNTTLRTCEPCSCNGNSESCLRSGKCLNCKNNSTGFHCEKCRNGTYGNASAADCKDCKCDKLGSLYAFCDTLTGQCPCKENVIGRNCSECRTNTYQMGENGCTECQCNPHGSSSLQCDDTGQCPCRPNTEGAKCTQCLVGFYGLPTKSCEACGCSSIGSVNGTVCTNDELGKCVCKPGVSGRACDSCKKQYTNLTSSGCSRCHGCPRNIQNRLDSVVARFINVSQDVVELTHLTGMNGLLVETTERLNKAKISSDQYASRIAESKKQSQSLLQSFIIEFANINSVVESQKKRMLDVIKILNLENKAVWGKISDIERKTRDSKNLTEGIPKKLQDLTKTFAGLADSMTEKVNKARTLFINHLSNLSVQDEIETVQETSVMARNLSQRVKNISNEVSSQDALIRALEFSMNQAAKYFRESQNDGNNDVFLQKLHDIYGSFSSATALINNIKNMNKASRILVEDATAILKHSENTVAEAKDNVEKAKDIYPKYKDMSVAAQGEVEISMLQYDFKDSVFLTKILQARNLLGRDLQTGLSDPYVVISIIPAWRNQPSQKSRIINGTTSPVFPFYDIYRFDIAEDEIPQTKVVVTLYDYDPESADDCLGEVVIDLADHNFFNKIVTKWFKVQPKGSTMLNSGNFNADGIGLIDLTTLLQMQIEQLTPRMTNAEIKLASASLNATNLRNIVDLLNRSSQKAFEYAERFLEIIRRYRNVSRKIDAVVQSSNETKAAIDSLMKFLSRKSAEKINEDFETTYKAIEELHRTLSVRNSSRLKHLEDSINAANKTFGLSLSLWNRINEHFPDLKAKTSLFQVESLKDASVRRFLTFANNITHISSRKMTQLTTEYDELISRMVTMVNKISHVLSLAANHTKIINEGVAYITKAETKLTSSPSPSENVLAALPIKENFEKTRSGYSEKVAALERQVNRIMNISRTFNFAMKFTGTGSVVFTPSKPFLQNKLSDNIEFDFKTNASRGGIIYVITSKNDLSKSTRIYVAGGQLCSTTDLGLGPRTLCHPDRVDNGEWYRAFFTRYRSYYSLTLVASDGRYTSVNKTMTQNTLEADYNEDTLFYLGGLPPGVLDGVVTYYGYYDGVLDHLRINTDRPRLWSSEKYYGEQLYHSNRLFPKHPPGPIYEASFFGTGYLYHKMGDFHINVSDVAAQIEFRTLRKFGVLLEVRNASHVPLLGVYIVDGDIKFLLLINSIKLILTSTRSSYNDGRWHVARFNVSYQSASLVVETSGSSAEDSRSVQLNSVWPEVKTQSGFTLLFGGTDTNSSIVPLTGTSFAGDMRNVRLSNKDVVNKLFLRDFVGPEWIKDEGVSYKGIIKEEIFYGFRFFGYLPYKGYGSFVAPEIQPERVLNLQFTFKTLKKDGILVYVSNKSISKNEEAESSFYVALWDGYLYVSFNNANVKVISPLYYKQMKLNDNKWHSVSVNFSDTRFRLQLNSKDIHTGDVRGPLVFGRLYIGGVEPNFNIPMPVPVYWSFKGALQTFLINSRELNIVSGKSEGVSFGGVSRAVVVTTVAPSTAPTAGPKCGAQPRRPLPSNDIGSVNFGATSYDYNATTPSYIGFNLNEKQKGFFKQSVVLTLEMRSLTMNGLIFYAADSESHPKDFISLELVDGKLRYQFSSATGQVTIQTIRRYALNAVWYKVYLLRILQLGAVVIPKTKEYHNNRHLNAASKINIATPFYIGGLPTHVNAPSLINRHFGFIGCLRNFEISSSQEDVGLDMTNPDVKGSSIGHCYEQLEPGAYFNGKAWMKYENVMLSRDFTMSFNFRTYQRSGLLLALDDAKGQGLTVYQKLGQLVLKYVNGNDTIELAWSPSSSSTSSIPQSFLICQMEWYSVKISKEDASLAMVINGAFEVKENVQDVVNLNTTLLLGQESTLSSEASAYYGCIKELVVNGVLLDLSRPSSQANVELSCPVNSELSQNEDDSTLS